MRTPRLAAIVAASACALGLAATPAFADSVETETHVTVSAPTHVVKRTPVTFSGRLTSNDANCISSAVISVTKPTPLSWQVGRRHVTQTDADGSFSYTKKIYRSGTWTFAFEGSTYITTFGDVVTCQPSSIRLTVRATRR